MYTPLQSLIWIPYFISCPVFVYINATVLPCSPKMIHLFSPILQGDVRTKEKAVQLGRKSSPLHPSLHPWTTAHHLTRGCSHTSVSYKSPIENWAGLTLLSIVGELVSWFKFTTPFTPTTTTLTTTTANNNDNNSTITTLLLILTCVN